MLHSWYLLMSTTRLGTALACNVPTHTTLGTSLQPARYSPNTLGTATTPVPTRPMSCHKAHTSNGIHPQSIPRGQRKVFGLLAVVDGRLQPHHVGVIIGGRARPMHLQHGEDRVRRK